MGQMLFPGEGITRKAHNSSTTGCISIVGIIATIVVGFYVWFTDGLYHGLQYGLAVFSITVIIVSFFDLCSSNGDTSISNFLGVIWGFAFYNFVLYWLGLVFTDFWEAIKEGFFALIVCAIVGYFLPSD